MTKGTDTRNIKLIVQSLLSKELPKFFDLANDRIAKGDTPELACQNASLLLEIELSSAWIRYMNEREEGQTPAQTREKITSEYMNSMISSPSAKMKQEIEDVLRLNISDTSAWGNVISFCIRMAQKGQTIQQYQQWREKDVFNSPKTHQIAQKPELVISTWPQAFAQRFEQKARAL